MSHTDHSDNNDHDTPHAPEGWHADADHSLVADDAWHDHSGEAPPQEVHGETSALFIAGLGVVSFCGLLVCIGLLAVYFNQVSRAEIIQKRERTDVAREFRERSAGWNAELTTYGWVDENNGVVRIPLDRAIELVVQEYGQKQ